MNICNRPIIQKTGNTRSRKSMQAARDQSCIRCGREDGTIVSAHYSGIEAHRLGKGMGTKGHDAATAELCGQCHFEFDNYQSGNDYKRAHEFLMLILLTIIRRYNEGVIK